MVRDVGADRRAGTATPPLDCAAWQSRQQHSGSDRGFVGRVWEHRPPDPEKKPRISRGGSRHLRRALYMPALVAIRHEPYLRAFYQRLLARGKAPLQAVVAVMRKLLHALFAMFHSDLPYDGSKLCPVKFAPDTVALCA